MSTATGRGVARHRLRGGRRDQRQGLGTLLRRRCRALLADLLGPHRRLVVTIFLLIVAAQLAGAGRAVADRDRDRQDPAAGQDPQRRPAGTRHRRRSPWRSPSRPLPPRPSSRARQDGRPGGPRAAAPPLRALPAAVHLLPRALHLGQGDLPPGLRHGLDLRAVRRGPGLAGVRRCSRCCSSAPGCCCSTGRSRSSVMAGFLPLAWLIAPGSSASLRSPTGEPGRPSRGHRSIRRDLQRNPRGPGLPPGAAERRDLRRAQPGLRRRQR